MKIYKIAKLQKEAAGIPDGYVAIEITIDPGTKDGDVFEAITKILGHGKGTKCSKEDMQLVIDLARELGVSAAGIEKTEEYYQQMKQDSAAPISTQMGTKSKAPASTVKSRPQQPLDVGGMGV